MEGTTEALQTCEKAIQLARSLFTSIQGERERSEELIAQRKRLATVEAYLFVLHLLQQEQEALPKDV